MQEKLKAVKAIVSDVDGVMTDGRLYFFAGGETKVFNVRDGLAIKLYQKAGGDFALLSGRESAPVRQRAEELGIRVVKVGRHDKQTAFQEIQTELGVAAAHIAYIGDDVLDLAPMELSAVAFCPADAVAEVRAVADFTAPCRGGDGVVRFAIETILKAQNSWDGLVNFYRAK